MTKALIFLATVIVPGLLVAQSGPAAFDIQPGWGPSSKGGYTFRPEGQAGPVTGRPFSAVELRRTTQILNDGSRVDHTEKGRFYRDPQGRMRVEGSTVSGNADLIVLFDPVSGLVYELNPRLRTYSEQGRAGEGGSAYIAVVSSGKYFMLADRGNRGSISSVGPEPVKEDLPATVMNGISVRGSRLTTTIPVGAFGNERELKVITERWFSDDLQAMVKSSNSDPRFGVTTYELTNIVQGPSDPALFQVPADYVAAKAK